MLSKHGVIAVLPNTQKQTQKAAKMRRQRNTSQMKEQIKTPEIRTKQNGHKQSIRYRVQTTDYKDIQGN